MREVCESCARAQSPDWRPGELCSFCGQAVRREVRCFWCVTWVPAAAFCRSCGAVVVEERLFGAARMLKDAGSDRFTIPKQLQEFPADQIENFARIYQRQAVVVGQHVDAVRFLEQFLSQGVWSAPLEDALVAQLPWPQTEFARLATGATGPAAPQTDLAQAIAIQGHTPFPLTGHLASLVRLRLQDWQAHGAVQALLRSEDPALRREAALALSGWRAWTQFGVDRAEARLILAELDTASGSLAAALGRALLGRSEPDAARDALDGADPELRFAAALVRGEIDRLQLALQGDALMRIAAGRAVIALGRGALLAETLMTSPTAVQLEWLQNLVRRKEPCPELGPVALTLLEQHADASLRERCARLLCRSLRPEWAVRIARAAQGERAIFQSLLAPETGLPQDAVSAVLDVMIQLNAFQAHQYGLMEAGRRGAVGDDFVIRRFAGCDQATRLALLRFAEEQLGARQDEALHRFVMGVVFGAHPAEVRAAAWWVLSRWYKRQGDHRGEGPFRLTQAGVERFFGSMAVFVPQLAAVLADRATMKEVGLFEFLATFLGSSDAAAIQAMGEAPGATDGLVTVLLASITGDYWPYTVESMITLASRLGVLERWRAQVLDGLARCAKHGNHAFDTALRRVQLAQYGIPEEDRWGELPADFAPQRFAQVPVAGQLELLQVVEYQMIHRPAVAATAVQERFLLGVVLGAGDLGIRIGAMRLHHERAAPRRPPLHLGAAALTAAIGPLEDVLEGLAGVLRTPELMAEPAIRDFVSELLNQSVAPPATMLITAGPAGRAGVQAMLEMLADAGRPDLDRLRRIIIRLLVPISERTDWRPVLVTALAGLAHDPDGGLRSEAAAALVLVMRQQPGPAAGAS